MHPPIQKPERQVAFNQKNWPQRNHILKQRLLLEGKVRAKEGEYEGATMIIPTAVNIDDWIQQSKKYGATLSYKERHMMNSNSPALRYGQSFLHTATTTMDVDPNYGTAMEIEKSAKYRMVPGIGLNSGRSEGGVDGSQLRSDRIQFNARSLKVDRKAVPLLPLNPNTAKLRGEEPYLNIANFQAEQEIWNTENMKRGN